MAKICLNEIAHSYLPDSQTEDEYALKRIHNIWDDGGAYALLGPSGCGKTTLLNIISGLLKPSRGKVLFGETDVTELPPEKRNIAQVFQFPVLYDTMTVYDNLAFPLRNRGFDKDYVDRRVREVADILELDDFLKKRLKDWGPMPSRKFPWAGVWSGRMWPPSSLTSPSPSLTPSLNGSCGASSRRSMRR